MLICVNALLSADACTESSLILKAACLSFWPSFICTVYFFLICVLIFEKSFYRRHLKLSEKKV